MFFWLLGWQQPVVPWPIKGQTSPPPFFHLCFLVVPMIIIGSLMIMWKYPLSREIYLSTHLFYGLLLSTRKVRNSSFLGKQRRPSKNIKIYFTKMSTPSFLGANVRCRFSKIIISNFLTGDQLKLISNIAPFWLIFIRSVIHFGFAPIFTTFHT